jgi:hypothetical protein
MLPLTRPKFSPHYPFIPQHSPLFTPCFADWLVLESSKLDFWYHYTVHRLTRLGRQSLVSFRRFSNSSISPSTHHHSLHHAASLASSTASVGYANRLQYHNSQISQMECTSDRELTFNNRNKQWLHCHPHVTASWEVGSGNTVSTEWTESIGTDFHCHVWWVLSTTRTSEIQETPSSSPFWSDGKCKALLSFVLTSWLLRYRNQEEIVDFGRFLRLQSRFQVLLWFPIWTADVNIQEKDLKHSALVTS